MNISAGNVIYESQALVLCYSVWPSFSGNGSRAFRKENFELFSYKRGMVNIKEILIIVIPYSVVYTTHIPMHTRTM